MSEADALLAAIRHEPDDDAPRLIYADWLDEHGQPERAEFIRVQIELARHDSPALRKREAELLAGHYSAFVNSFKLPGVCYRFSRGFISGFGHSGCFASADKDGVSMYRFFPDQVFISRYSIQPLDQAVRELHRNHPYVLPGTYRLRSTDNTLELETDSQARFGGENRRSGCMRIGRLCLSGYYSPAPAEYDLIDPASDRTFDEVFEHVHIDGFDSFQDSP